MSLSNQLENKAKTQADSRPVFFNLSKISDRHILQKLLKQNKIQHVVDDYLEQIKEYFQITNPQLVFSPGFEAGFKSHLKKLTSKQPLSTAGLWVYFPWNSTLAHILEEKAFFSVRTARNQNLITKAEQKKFYNTVIGIAGLSVGNSAALAIVLQGGAKHIKLADHDKLALSNTNRIRTSIGALGLLKVQMTARQIYELNPYAKVEIYPEGLNEKNIHNFCQNLDIIVDEVDNLSIKYLLRVQAKKRKLPVVMAADNGDNGIVDIERYDQNPKLAFFHGRLGKTTYEDLKNLSKRETGRLITKLLGVENVTVRMHDSLQQMGKTLVSWPQLGGAALLNGSAIAYCIRKIANNQPLESKRAIICIEEKLQPDYFSKTSKKQRLKSTQAFKKVFGL